MTSSNVSTQVQPTMSDKQKENIKKLVTDFQNSTDVPISEIDFEPLKATVKDAFSDRVLTQTEIQAIGDEVAEIIDVLGITNAEARVLYYDLQNIAQDSRLPRSDDNVIGTAGDDVLWGGRGNDTLTGVDTTLAGAGEIDWLIGGGGCDTFVLGNATTAFYNDNVARSAGLNDYALIIDFNLAQDTIQLHGSASEYTLGAVPTSAGTAGTAIFYKASGDLSAPELVGVVAGVNLTDFSTGFTFA